MTDKIAAWSYSRYNTYKQCPGKAKILYVDKLKEPGSEAMERGKQMHTDMEHFLKGYLEMPPFVKKRLKPYYEDLKSKKPATELQVAFNSNWEPVEWFGSDAWARIMIDALVYDKEAEEVTIIDHKTGKIRDGEYEEQLELYALTAFLMFPKAKTAKTELAFIDQDLVLPASTYAAEDKDMLLARWVDRTNVMLNDTTFEYTPNQYCNWCHFRKNNGGVCTAA